MLKIPHALDALNFLSADVRNLFGPFINVYLVTDQHWTQTDVGLVTTASGLLGIALQTPIGAAIDVTRAKRAVIVATMAAMTVAAIIIFAFPTFWPIALATSMLALAGDVFVPAVSALTLGLVRREQLARRLGRNSAFNHGGNIAIALVAGGVGYLFSQRVVFLLVPLFAALTSAAVLTIPARRDRPRPRARSRRGRDDDGAAAGYGVLFRTPPAVIFAVCALLFHFANAPLLPLVGQKLALQFPKEATAMLSFCMVAAQGVMLPIAHLVGRNADRIGRRPIFLVAFAVLPIRAALYTFSDNAFWLLGVQLLDGVGAGIYEALTPLLIADVMRGTGRYNLAQGAVATTQGVGAVDQRAGGGRRGGPSRLFGRVPVSRRRRGDRLRVSFVLLMPETRNGRANSRRRPGRGGRRSAGRMNATAIVSLAILVLTYVGVAVGGIPGLRLDRAGIAFLGGAAMIAVGPLSLDEAFRAIDLDTIALLLGMMIVVAHLKVSGAFRALGALAIEHAHAPLVAAGHDDGARRRALGLPGQRRDLPRDDADRPCRSCGAEAQSGALSRRDRDGVQLRQRRDDHRQSAEHGDRRGVGHPLSGLRRGARAGRGLRARRGRRRRVARRSARNSPRRRVQPASQARPHARRPGGQGGLVCAGLAVAFFAGVAAGRGGDRRRRDPAVDPLDQAERIYREIDGPLLMLFAGLFVVVAGRRAGAADAGARSRWRRASASTSPGGSRR